MGDININCLDKKNEYYFMNDMLLSHNICRFDLTPTRITPTFRTSINCVCNTYHPQELNAEVIDTDTSDHTGQLSNIHSYTGQTEHRSYSIPNKNKTYRSSSSEQYYKERISREGVYCV